VKFLLASTDPQKVPVTVLSRCLQFNLKRMASGALADYLGRILTAESIEFERPALELIAGASEGSVRDSLSLVEQAAAYGEGAVREAEVESMLGRASVDRLLGLIESLGQNDLPELFERVEQLAEYAPDFNELMGEILSLLHRIALLQSVPGSVPEDTPGFSRLNQLAESLAGDEVQLFYQIGTHARRDMPFAPDPREAFDMALLRMQAFRPEGGLPASAATRIPAAGVVAKARVPEPSAKPATAKPAGPRTGSLSAGVPAATPAASRKPVVIPAQPTTPAPSIASTAGATRTPDTGGAAVTASAGTGSAADGFDTSVSCVASEDRASVGPKDWYRMVSELDVSGMPRQLASNCELVSVEAERVLLHLESASEHLHSARFIERVESALCSWLGRKVRLDVQLVDAVLDTPARIEERVRAEDMAAARQSIDQDPLVRQLIDRVDGSVDEASIAPLNER
jgi:DNA polymerase-3 subunit gamma/tau